MRTAALLLACQLAQGALPATDGETLDGRKVSFPALLAGQPAVCVFSFSREAGEKTRAWMEPLVKANANAYSVANLEAAPRLVRGLIRRGMRSGTPEAFRGRSIILTSHEKAWRQALQVADDQLPVVVKFDAAGAVVDRYAGAFDPRVLERFLQ
jgi:hypothetical protein